MDLQCGCEITHEGGYGDYGQQGRYGVDWCPMHAAAQEMFRALRTLSAAHWPECDCNRCTLLARIEKGA